jgi:hypothetical protein
MICRPLIGDKPNRKNAAAAKHTSLFLLATRRKMSKRILISIVLLLLVIYGQLVFATQRSSKLIVRELMTREQFQASGLHKLSASELAVLDQWFYDTAQKLVKLGASESKGGIESSTNDFSTLEGSTIVAEDGQFLGKITANSVDSQSIINEVGRFGSEVSSTSIRNSVGRYGSEVSSLSPFNEVASTPPRIFKNGRFVAYLTTNSVKTPRVDPRSLVGWLQSQK